MFPAPRPAPSRHAETRLREAVRAALLGIALAAAVGAAHAQTDAGQALESPAPRVYDIPAGPLRRALSNFAASSELALSFDPALTDGLTSPAGGPRETAGGQ